jgi:hypothetical protein
MKIGELYMVAFPEAVPAILLTVELPRVKPDDFEKS